MKESKENKDNLSKIRKCVAKGGPLADILSSEFCLRIPDEKLNFTPMGRYVQVLTGQEHHVTESTEIHSEESEITGTTAEIFDSGIDHEM